MDRKHFFHCLPVPELTTVVSYGINHPSIHPHVLSTHLVTILPWQLPHYNYILFINFLKKFYKYFKEKINLNENRVYILLECLSFFFGAWNLQN